MHDFVSCRFVSFTYRLSVSFGLVSMIVSIARDPLRENQNPPKNNYANGWTIGRPDNRGRRQTNGQTDADGRSARRSAIP